MIFDTKDRPSHRQMSMRRYADKVSDQPSTSQQHRDADCCAASPSASMTDEAAAQLAAGFKALADPTRMKLLSMIGTATGGEACEPVGLSQPTVSHHMKLLAAAGLVVGEKRGRWTYYRVVSTELDRLASALRGAAS